MKTSILSAYLGLSPYRIISANDNLLSSKINKINLRQSELSVTFNKVISSKTFVIEIIQNEKIVKIRAQQKKISSDGLTFVLTCELIEEGKFDRIYYAKQNAKVSIPTKNIYIDKQQKSENILGEFSVNLVGDKGIFLRKDETIEALALEKLGDVNVLLDGFVAATFKVNGTADFGADFLYLKGEISPESIALLSADESSLTDKINKEINKLIDSGLIIC